MKPLRKLEIDNCSDPLEWEDNLNYLDSVLEDFNEEYFFAQTGDFGWRNLSGYILIEYTDAKEFLSKLFPKCEWHCLLSVYSDRLEATLYHHDSPTGEHYTIQPLKTKIVRSFNYNEISRFCRAHKEQLNSLGFIPVENNKEFKVEALTSLAIEYGLDTLNVEHIKRLV